MTDIVDALLAEAEAAMAEMRAAALRARALHARAELMRHMRGTAAKMRGRPLNEAAALVAREWMKAWQLDDAAYANVSTPVARFTRAFCFDALASTDATQAEILAAMTGLDTALSTLGTSIADQMAWRSECAHAWWDLVVPAPADVPDRASVPLLRNGVAFWENGCAERCRGA
jgi:hypothetical protein